jgi:glycosyltransferase involved in cell wall biosynthesis
MPDFDLSRVLRPAVPAGRRVAVVLPAYNAARTLAATLEALPPGCVDDLLLVDDASRDDTVAVAKGLGLPVIVHDRNRGYGGNQKTCYRWALDRGADVVVMLHPDNQYDARMVPHAVGVVELGICDVVLGNRVRCRREALDGGMPWWKYLANRGLTLFQNFATGQNLGEWHSGFRVYHRNVLEAVPFDRNSDDFAFDAQFLVQAVRWGFRLGDVPVPVRYFSEASSIGFGRSVRYGLLAVAAVGEFWRWRLGLPAARLR